MIIKNLAAPFIPAALPDGLIKIDEVQSDITIIIDVWEYSHERDTYQLMINGNLFGPVEQLPAPVPPVGTKLMLCLPVKDLISDGFYQIAYQATNVLGKISANSPATPIRIDRTRPGGALLAPMILSDRTLVDQVRGFVPGYVGMEPGDTIQTLLNGAEGPAHTVHADELSLRPVEIIFARELMQGLAGQTVVFEYNVTDRAGNTSMMSLPACLT